MIIGRMVVVAIYVFSFLRYKIPCMYIRSTTESTLDKINQSIQGLQQK